MTTHERFTAKGAGLLIVDIQERLMSRMRFGSRIIANAERLILVAKTLGIPIFATEQYPKGLGPTVSPLRELLPIPHEKTSFHALGAEGLADAMRERGLTHVTLSGMETHVCIAQTALELMNQGYRVQVPADAVTSRDKFDWQFGLRRLENAGVVVSSSESVLFEWLEGSNHPDFRQVSQLIKTFHSPEPL